MRNTREKSRDAVLLASNLEAGLLFATGRTRPEGDLTRTTGSQSAAALLQCVQPIAEAKRVTARRNTCGSDRDKDPGKMLAETARSTKH